MSVLPRIRHAAFAASFLPAPILIDFERLVDEVPHTTSRLQNENIVAADALIAMVLWSKISPNGMRFPPLTVYKWCSELLLSIPFEKERRDAADDSPSNFV